MLKISTVNNEAPTEEMQELLQQIQKNAIALSVDVGELISLIKQQDPDYTKQIEEMEK